MSYNFPQIIAEHLARERTDGALSYERMQQTIRQLGIFSKAAFRSGDLNSMAYIDRIIMSAISFCDAAFGTTTNTRN